jgi:hypothetical protein
MITPLYHIKLLLQYNVINTFRMTDTPWAHLLGVSPETFKIFWRGDTHKIYAMNVSWQNEEIGWNGRKPKCGYWNASPINRSIKVHDRVVSNRRPSNSTIQMSNLSPIKLILDLTRHGQMTLLGYLGNDFKGVKMKTFEWITSKIHSKLGGYTH